MLASSVSKIIGVLITARFFPIKSLPEARFTFNESLETLSSPSIIPFKLNILKALRKVDSGISVSKFKSFIKNNFYPSKFTSSSKLFH